MDRPEAAKLANGCERVAEKASRRVTRRYWRRLALCIGQRHGLTCRVLVNEERGLALRWVA
jgi:hypothetical protein